VTLLRVLETGEIFPVGGDKPVAVQVRLIAATDANLEDRIRQGQFKAPLLHRLASYEVRLPPLRERRDDIGPLFCHFAREELGALGETHRLSPSDPYARPWVPAHVAAQLVRYPWPGNIRELRNVTRQLVIESRGLPQLRLDSRLADQLGIAANEPRPVRQPSDPAIDLPSPTDPAIEVRRKPSDVTETELLEALRACAWDLKAAADRLRIPRPSIYDLIDKSSNIRTAGELSVDEISECFRAYTGDVDGMAAHLQVSKRALQRRLRELGLISRSRVGRAGAEPEDPD
jgi:two-component system nitrogen regulation response regulator GlnG